MTEIDNASIVETILSAISGSDFLRATFAGPRRGPCVHPWVRVSVRPVELRHGQMLQITYFETRKSTTKNVPPAELASALAPVLEARFAGIHIDTQTQSLDIRISKKGKITLGQATRQEPALEASREHDRRKALPLPEGRADAFLERLGVLTRDGTVRPSMRAKFTQINAFLQQLEHCLASWENKPPSRPVQILDCGCGASYLTLATHHYLNTHLEIPARVLGVDINPEVIQSAGERLQRMDSEDVSFTCAPIGRVETPADIVLALHACDTATDDAIVQTIRSRAQVLLSVPCCHKHLQRQLHIAGPTEVLRPILRHGILRQRLADQVTDAFRALILRMHGYRTEIIEFTTTEHTARNLMIRAVYRGPQQDAQALQEYLEMKAFWQVIPYLETALGADFQSLLAQESHPIT